MISPAPTLHNPSGLRPVAATGAGVQFATDPCRASWDEDNAGFAARMLTQDRYIARSGRWLQFWQGPAGLGVPQNGPARHGKDVSPAARAAIFTAQHGTPRLRPAGLGWARLGAAKRDPRRYSGAIFRARPDTARRGSARQGTARPGKHATGGGNPGHFPKHQEAPASCGATVEGMTGTE